MSLSDQDLTAAAAGADPLVGLRAVRALRRLLEHLEETQVTPGPCRRLVVAGDRRGARRQPAGRAQEAPAAAEEATMFERFTQRSRAVVERGRRGGAGRPASPEVRPEHLLEAILAEGDGVAVAVLAEQGAPADELLAAAPRAGAAVPEPWTRTTPRRSGCSASTSTRSSGGSSGDLGGDAVGPDAGTCPSRSGSKKALELALREALAARGRLHRDRAPPARAGPQRRTRSCSTRWRRSTSTPDALRAAIAATERRRTG